VQALTQHGIINLCTVSRAASKQPERATLNIQFWKNSQPYEFGYADQAHFIHDF